jgi:hypothetical protein
MDKKTPIKTGRKPTTMNKDNYGTGYAKMVTSSKLYDAGLPGAAKKMGREALDQMDKKFSKSGPTSPKRVNKVSGR